MSEQLQTANSIDTANSQPESLPPPVTLAVQVDRIAGPTATELMSAPANRALTARQAVLDAITDWTTHEKIVEVTKFEPKAVWKILTAKDLQKRIERRQENGKRMEFRHKPAENPRCEILKDAMGAVWLASRLGCERIGCGRNTLLGFESGCRYLDDQKRLKYWEPPGQIGHYHQEIDIQQIALRWNDQLGTSQLKILGKKQKNGYLKAIRFAKKRTADGKRQVFCQCMRCKRTRLVLVALTRFLRGKVRSCGCLRREQAPVNAKSGHHRLLKRMTADKLKTHKGKDYVARRVAMRMLGVDGATVRAWAISCPWLNGAGIGTYLFTDSFDREVVYYLKADLDSVLQYREAAPAIPKYDGFRSIRSVQSLLGISRNQYWYDMDAIGRKTVRKSGKKRNNTSGTYGYVTEETFQMLCHRRSVIAGTEVIADLQPATGTTSGDSSAERNTYGQNTSSTNPHNVHYPDLDIHVDFIRHAIRSGTVEVKFNGPVEWHFVKVALAAHPDNYTLGQLQDGYPGTFNKNARAVAKQALNEKMMPLKVTLHQYKILRIGKITA